MQWPVERTSRKNTNDETLQGKLEIEQRDKNGGKLGCFRRVGNSCSISDKRPATLVANLVISRERTQWMVAEWMKADQDGCYQLIYRYDKRGI